MTSVADSIINDQAHDGLKGVVPALVRELLGDVLADRPVIVVAVFPDSPVHS